MNRTFRYFSMTMIIILVLLAVSCRSDGPSGVNIVGLWSGTLVSNDYDTDGQLVIFEFLDTGKANIGDPDDNVIYEEAVGIDFIWSLDENYLTITAWAGFYYAEYYYNLINDNTLRLVLLQRNFFNDTYENLEPGDSVYLVKSEESFSDLMQVESSYY